ncbi:MAG: prolyl oligopeptidase family serine peptidase [Pseudomonadota bacterium]
MRSVIFALALFGCGSAIADGHDPLTLEKIMSDPDWIGNAPESAYWDDSSRAVHFRQKRVGESIRDPFVVDTTSAEISAVLPTSGVTSSNATRRYDATRERVIWVSDGDVFMRSLPAGDVVQLTRTVAPESAAQFVLGEEAVSYQLGGQFYRHDLATGAVSQLANLQFQDDPNKDESFDALREHQRRVYTSIVEDKRRRDAVRDVTNERRAESPVGYPATVYLGKKLAPVVQVLSPKGDAILVVTRPADEKSGKRGVMPNYMTESGYTETRALRPRVGRNVPKGHRFWMVTVASGAVSEVTLDDLDGIDTDPLSALRQSALEWHVDHGADPQKVEKQLKAPDARTVQVGGAAWSPDGSRVAIQLHAVDNKDRWLVTVDADAEMTLEHRLTDPAWVNYAHNDFGWFADSRELWLLSEESGYSHLYRKKIGARKARALTEGRFVVSDVALGASGTHLYFRANADVTSVYEIYRVARTGGGIEKLTTLGGVNHFRVSPDESTLLVIHSEFARHEDLFAVDIGTPDSAQRLTDSVSSEFKSIDWVIPQIVKVPSSNVDRDIYSKLYLPADYDGSRAYPVVMFVHGAGYTQNAHAGWPYYFREFMFHTLLAQQDVIVIDMDYRASKGYGRDWRTAIYRNMGRPELADFVDGIDWLDENYNIDRDKLGIYGGSYGGFMTFMAMFLEPDLFAAGAALRPVADWAHYNHGYTSNILNTPLVDPVAYERSSPIHYVEGLANPLLIAAGMQDDNVFFQDSVLMVQRLLELQKPDFEIALYPLDPHGFTHADSWLDEYRRIYKLFDRHVF